MSKFLTVISKLYRNVNRLNINNFSANSVNRLCKCRNILDLCTEEKINFFDSFDFVLSDCDGVIWQPTGPFPKAGEALDLLYRSGKKLFFITNNGNRTDQEVTDKIQNLGHINITKDDVVNPVKVFACHAKSNFPQEICYCIGSRFFIDYLNQMGVKAKDVSCPASFKAEDIPKIVRPPMDAKIAVFSANIYQQFTDYILSHQFLKKSDCQLFVSATDKEMRLSDDIISIGAGVLFDGISKISPKKPILFGKPSKLMGHYVTQTYQIKDCKRVLFIGDNLCVDIKFAKNQGFQSMSVLTGVHTKENMLALPYHSQPDYYANSLSDFLLFFEDMCG